MKKKLFKQALSYYFYMIVLALLLSQGACFSGGKQTQKTSIILKPDLPNSQTSANTPKQAEMPKTKLPETTTEIMIQKELSGIDTSNNKLIPKEPLVYSIAIMLPLGARNYLPNATMDSVPESSNLALEFYEGVLSALEKLKQEGVSLQVQVYDTENDPDVVEQILQTPQLKAAHVILGPVYNRELKPVAAFAKKHKIYHISPLSPSGEVAEKNPYYLIANPSIEAQCAAIYKYIARSYGKKRIITVCGNKPNETTLANLFYHFGNPADAANPDFTGYIPVSQITYTFQQAADLESYLSPTDDNMVVATSFDPLLIHDLSSKLNTLRSKYRITLFGMPNWLNMEIIDYGYMANLNLHLSLPFFQAKNDADNIAFRHYYFYTYKMQPSEYACRGYDLMLWLGRALKNNGRNFAQSPNEVNPKGLYTRFVFEPASANQYNSSAKSFTLDFLENKFVNIVHYRSDFIFEPVNW